jgi:toxin HigB-1
MAIKGCRDRDTEAFLAGERVRKFEQCAKQARKAIAKLQAAEQLIDLRNPPSNNFERLEGELGYSIRIDRKWRACFKWETREPVAEGADILTAAGEPYDVEITNHYD